MLSILGILVLIYIVQKQFRLAKALASTMILGIIFGLPYIFITFKATQHSWYADTASRMGLIYGHDLVINKVILAALVVFFIISIGTLRNRGQLFAKINYWWWFCLALLLAGAWVFIQQFFTGIAVWPPHFVQYTIPLSIVVTIVLIHKAILPLSKHLWVLIIIVVIISSVSLGVFGQVSSYQINFEKFKNAQSFIPVFEWFNQNSIKDSVILTTDERGLIRGLIPAYTHNNTYTSKDIITLFPTERLLHNYMVDMKISGIQPDELDQYIKNNLSLHKTYLGGLVDFKDIKQTDYYLKNKEIFPEKYSNFFQSDFYEALKKYRLDYVLSYGELVPGILNQLPQLELVTTVENFYIYQLP